MSTPCVIGVKEGEKVTWVHVHGDGGINVTGLRLVNHYETLDKAKSLIAGGDFAYLEPNKDNIRYYAESGERNVDPQVADLFMFYRCNKSIIKYLYEDGLWYGVKWLYHKPGEYVPFMEQYKLEPLNYALEHSINPFDSND